MSFVVVVLAVIVVALLLRKMVNRGPKCDVPLVDFGDKSHWLLGLMRVPFEKFAVIVTEKSRTVGPLFRFHFVPWVDSSIVVVNDLEMMKEMFSRKEFASRDPVEDAGVHMLNPNKKGIILQDYTPVWKNLHKLSLSILNSFGFGKQSMEIKVLEEADALVSAMLSIEDAFAPDDLIRVAVSNVTCKLVFSERSEIRRGSALHASLLVASGAFFDLSNDPVYILWPRLIDWYKTPRAARIHEAVTHVKSHVTSSVARHEATLDEADEPRDFIDAFIRERRQHPGAEHLDDENMTVAIMDLFQAGTDTTSAMMNWTVAWLLHRPDVGERVREELVEVLGEDGAPTMAQLPRLNYLRAFMDEVQRISCVADFSVPHRCLDKAEFRGYTITKKESIWMNIYAVHKDPKLWDDPEVFKPERFLDADGKYQKNNNLTTFGWGNRRCLGERLALLEQFVFTARLMQRLEFRPASALPDMSGQIRLVRIPAPYAVKVQRRN